MSTHDLRGVVPILVTPFHEDGRLDEESLAQLIDFNIDAGARGLGVALGSEIYKLSDDERQSLVGGVVDLVRARVPVVVNAGAAGTDLAALHGRRAEAAGADVLMVYPPHFLPAGADETLAYYRAIDEAVGIPIMLQDLPQAPIAPGLAVRIAETCPGVRYIKVESLPAAHRVSDMVAAVGERLAVFGGAGGAYFLEELSRGAVGTMPFGSQPGTFVEVWRRFLRGDEPGARTFFDRTILRVNHLGALGGDIFFHLHKRMLVRQGVIRTATVRAPTLAIDAVTHREIDRLVDNLFPAPRPFGAWKTEP